MKAEERLEKTKLTRLKKEQELADSQKTKKEHIKICSRIKELETENKEMVRFTQLRWSNIFVQNSSHLLSAILDYLGIEHDFSTVLNVCSSEALDPHVNRERFREGLWS